MNSYISAEEFGSIKYQRLPAKQIKDRMVRAREEYDLQQDHKDFLDDAERLGITLTEAQRKKLS